MTGDPKPTDWLDAVEAAAYVRAPSVDALRMWAKRHHVVVGHRGRRVLYLRADLDAAVMGAGLRLVYGRKVS